ncbi:hypothetical protein IW136_003431, partial [Coemansia sp. RSA 678]
LIAAFSGAGHAAPVTEYNGCVNSVVLQLISMFETGSTELNFANCRKDSDGSGYASGIISFTTRHGDALKVIKKFMTTSSYKGEFDDYLDTLEDIVYDKYNVPSQEYVEEIGIKFSVTRAVLYDMAIVGGLGSSNSTLGGIFNATNNAFDSDVSGKSGNSVNINDEYQVDEAVWLQKFLDIREKNSSAGHKNIEAYRSIITHKDFNWSNSVTVTDSDGDDMDIKCRFA